MLIKSSGSALVRMFALFLSREGDVTFRRWGSSACNIRSELEGRRSVSYIALCSQAWLISLPEIDTCFPYSIAIPWLEV